MKINAFFSPIFFYFWGHRLWNVIQIACKCFSAAICSNMSLCWLYSTTIDTNSTAIASATSLPSYASSTFLLPLRPLDRLCAFYISKCYIVIKVLFSDATLRMPSITKCHRYSKVVQIHSLFLVHFSDFFRTIWIITITMVHRKRNCICHH